ncbi:MAG: hypothetical protein LRY51_03955 [Geovibrio sp.]|nr:hypothetical protein [Geovibrio sp.]
MISTDVSHKTTRVPIELFETLYSAENIFPKRSDSEGTVKAAAMNRVQRMRLYTSPLVLYLATSITAMAKGRESRGPLEPDKSSAENMTGSAMQQSSLS